MSKTFNKQVPEDYMRRLKALKDELEEKVKKSGAWVEDKGLLVAWHYRCAQMSTNAYDW